MTIPAMHGFFMQRMIVRSRAIETPEKRGTYRE